VAPRRLSVRCIGETSLSVLRLADRQWRVRTRRPLRSRAHPSRHTPPFGHHSTSLKKKLKRLPSPLFLNKQTLRFNQVRPNVVGPLIALMPCQKKERKETGQQTFTMGGSTTQIGFPRQSIYLNSLLW